MEMKILSVDKELELIYKRVGKNIAYFRKQRGLNQENFANELHIGGQSLISQYENGKKLSLEKINCISNYFNIPLEEFLFVQFEKDSTSDHFIDIIPQSAPIYKCAGKTYFCYFIKEQNDGKSDFSVHISCIEIKILGPKTTHTAEVKLKLAGESEVDALLIMDGSYGYIESRDINSDLYLQIVFFYYRTHRNKHYNGGVGLMRGRDEQHLLPICQYCIISKNAIANRHNSKIIKLLQIDVGMQDNEKPSNKSFSSSAIIRLTKKRDKEVYQWLKKNVNLGTG